MHNRHNKSMVIVTVRLPKEYIDVLRVMVKRRIYPNVAEVIRTAVRDLIINECHLLSINWPLNASEKPSDGEEDF